MRSMAIDRRTFLAATTALIAPRAARATTDSVSARYISAAATLNGRYTCVLVGETGEILAGMDLAARGHGLAVRPNGADVMCFARRPGAFAMVLDRESGDVVTEIAAATGRHFSGHGVYVDSGALLLATENDEALHQGAIGVYDARDGYARLGEFPTHGIGPHDLALLPDATTLVVANGGIDKRHDDTGGVDPADIRSDLAYLDWRSGRLLDRVALEFPRLSIRHLALTASGDVAAALQDSAETPDLDWPLGFVHRLGAAPRWLETPQGGWARFRGYCGAAGVDSGQGLIAMSSPRGNCVALWDESGAAVETLEVHDGCGLSDTSTPGQLLVSSGGGELFTIAGGKPDPTPLNAASGYRFDNHIKRI